MKRAAAIILVLSCFIGGKVQAQPLNSPETPLPINVSLTRKFAANNTSELLIYVTLQTNKFVMRQPENYRMFNDYARHSFKLVSSDSTRSISFRILVGDDAADSAVYRKWLLNRQPDAHITEESSAMAGDLHGPAFNIRRPLSIGLVECSRAAFIPCPAGLMEFTATANTASFNQVQTDLNVLLMSFRAEKDGKLDLPAFGGPS
jgi:hypothetical protein